MSAMKHRKPLLLGAIVALSATLAVQLYLEGRETIRTLKLEAAPDSITVEKAGGEKVELRKEGDSWVLAQGGKRADPAAATAMADALSSVKILDTVSRDGDHERYGVQDGAALTATASSGDKVVRTLAIGKASSTSRQTYVRVDGSRDVSLAAGSLKETFDKSADALRDKTVHSFDAAKVRRAAAEYSAASEKAGRDFAVEKAAEGGAWTVARAPAGAAVDVDPEKLLAWLQGVATLRATSFAAPGSAAAEGKPLCRFAVVLEDGKEIRLDLLRKETDGSYLCASSETEDLFVLPGYAAERFLKAPGELAK